MSKLKSTLDDVPGDLNEELEALRYVPAPDRIIWENSRQAFLVSAGKYQRETVSSGLPVRHKSWREAFQAFISQFLPTRKEFRMSSLITLLSTVAVLLSLGVGAVTAAPNSLPGSLLYPLKQAWEYTNLNLSNDPVNQVEMTMIHAQNRLEEMNMLVQKGVDIPPALMLRYQNSLQYAFENVNNLPEPLQTRLLTQLQTRLQTHQKLLDQIMVQLHAQTRTQTRDQLRLVSQTISALQERLRLRLQTQNQIQSQTQNKTQTQNQNQIQSQNQIQTQTQSQSQVQTQTQNQTQSQTQNQVQNQPQVQSTSQSQNGSSGQNQNQQPGQNQNQTGKP